MHKYKISKFCIFKIFNTPKKMFVWEVYVVFIPYHVSELKNEVNPVELTK